MLAGLALLVAGLSMLGLLGRRAGPLAAWVASLWSQALGPLLSARPAGASLGAGMIVGLLPCPLVYAGLAAAAASGSPLAGALTLAGVALGTVPALGVLAMTGLALPSGWRQGLARAAGVLLLVVGTMTIARGAGLHAGHAHHAGHAQPTEAGSPPCHGGQP
jgi:sulfite exporter TauE/SafE